ncbi:hypothetical protein MES4922_410024 [Mesorhizobium ventifaucium]|uniref:Uncharacterized protein n=1 Tax=Mesorhizobium ventifaucium TaxID=666020 RepID=A0ABM9E9P8_9HYPH|nr:hypothetical protein MES4922_410024 [Mesorhizobium ventifaucium]
MRLTVLPSSQLSCLHPALINVVTSKRQGRLEYLYLVAGRVN